MLKDLIWVHLPHGFRLDFETRTGNKASFLKLQKPLYGHAIAPQLCNKHLIEVIHGLRFEDQCLLYKACIFIVLYVDDCVITAKSKSMINDSTRNLRSCGFKLQREGSFPEFLRISIDPVPKGKEGRVYMTQKGLIQKILKVMKMEDMNPNWTLAHKSHSELALE
jgi:hypothetical protein